MTPHPAHTGTLDPELATSRSDTTSDTGDHPVPGHAPVTVLTGHVSPDTAYYRADHPYGNTGRCAVRWWIETATRGGARGLQRVMTQTTNPHLHGQPWNRPKPRPFRVLAVLYLDHHGDVHWWTTGVHLHPDNDARARRLGIIHQLDEQQRRTYDRLLAMSRRARPADWATTPARDTPHPGDQPHEGNTRTP